jgi:hypothetical protein
MYDATIDRARHTITFRASGVLTVEDMKNVFEETKRATDSFRGQPHLVLADMRGLAPLSPEATGIFGEVIRYGRTHGTICCVHLSDSSIARLQANRLAREASPYDDITVNVVSMEEAAKVIDEKLAGLRPPKAG